MAVWLSSSASHAQPPADVTADATQYGLVGGRLIGDFDWGTLRVDGRYGAALAGSDGRWLQGDAALTTGGRMGPIGLRGAVSAFGLRYLDPFRYDAGGAELRPAVSIPAGRSVLSLMPRLSWGRWSTVVEGATRMDPDTRIDGALRVLGGGVEVQRPFGAWTTVISGGVHWVENGATEGTFARADGELIFDRGRWTATARLGVQRTPEETELGGGLQLSVTATPGLELRGHVGRRVRDPLFGTEGTPTASLTVSVRAVRWSPPHPPPIVEVGERQGAGRVVRFALRAPGAREVALTGDFTGWEPAPMEEGTDGWWRLQQVVEPGLHHFGFLVDGTWALPPGAPGLVEDGWGRRNASVVVEP